MAATKGKITLFNPEQTPTVYSEDGRSVGGAERVTVDELDSAGQHAVDTGLLVREEPEKDEPATASKDAPPSKDEKSGDDSGSGASSRGKRT